MTACRSDAKKVETLNESYPACLVEFVDDDGATKAEAAFAPDH